jgi:hypothetical protein
MSHGAVGVRAPACGSRRQLLQHPCDLHRIRRRSKRGSSKHGGKECTRSDVPKIKSRRFGEIWQTGGSVGPGRGIYAEKLWTDCSGSTLANSGANSWVSAGCLSGPASIDSAPARAGLFR